MPRLKRVKSGEGVGYHTCRHCGGTFRAISYSHLFFVHGRKAAHPRMEYARRYGLRSPDCERTRHLHRLDRRKRFKQIGPKWNRSRLLDLIDRRAKLGLPLNHAAVIRDAPTAPKAARGLFGGWDALLRAGGFQPERVRKKRYWDHTLILEEFKRRAREGRPLSYRAAMLEDPGFADAAVARFGSWAASLQSAGLDPERYRRQESWTPERVLQEIKRLGRGIRLKEARRTHPKLADAGHRHFGTWRAAVVAAGFQYPEGMPPRRWTLEAIQKVIRERREQGLSLRSNDLKGEFSGLLNAARLRFGTWKAARAAAGVLPEECRYRVIWTREKIEDAARELERQGCFGKRGYGLGTRPALRSAIERRYGETASIVVKRILNVSPAALSRPVVPHPGR